MHDVNELLDFTIDSREKRTKSMDKEHTNYITLTTLYQRETIENNNQDKRPIQCSVCFYNVH